MAKSRTIPLARGLIAGEDEPVYGQLELSLTNYKNIRIVIRRKPYTGRSNVKFSISSSNLQEFIDILQEAKEKLDETWLSRVATKEFKGIKRQLIR